MRRLDILYIGTLPPHPGGSAVVAGQVLPRLAARGHRIRAVSPTLDAVADREALDRKRLPGVETARYQVAATNVDTIMITLPMARRELRPLRSAVRRAIGDTRPDLVVGGRENYALHVAPIARAWRVPMVQVCHARYLGGAFDEDHPVRARRLRHRMARAARLLLVAEHLREVLGPIGVPMDTAVNGVELDRFTPASRDAALARSLGLRADAIVVMHPSNLKAVKRVTDLVASARLVVPHDPRVQYLIVGDGPERDAIGRAIGEAGLARDFRFTGWQERAGMPALYALADIVVMPSSTEALALAYLETMASGRVLIASDIPAAREVVDDGRNGLLFPMGDVDALAAVTLRAAGDPALRARIGAAARTTALGHGIDEVVDRWEETLSRSVARAGSIAG